MRHQHPLVSEVRVIIGDFYGDDAAHLAVKIDRAEFACERSMERSDDETTAAAVDEAEELIGEVRTALDHLQPCGLPN